MSVCLRGPLSFVVIPSIRFTRRFLVTIRFRSDDLCRPLSALRSATPIRSLPTWPCPLVYQASEPHHPSVSIYRTPLRALRSTVAAGGRSVSHCLVLKYFLVLPRLVEARYNIRTVQELLSHNDVSTAMICTHAIQARIGRHKSVGWREIRRTGIVFDIARSFCKNRQKGAIYRNLSVLSGI
ncbi:MAG: hypothetical protein A4E57_02122 [Syntrophorhabdaceae bacterium PtaU1.Bin034]|nr:MAG: hypothetical protein A4E57_02122 [Syntrophorhabdaceae bacterium PtaU1.Bin034]